jgi:hypothetical protein
MSIEFEKKVSIGHVITVVSVIVSVTGLLVSWSQSRQLQTREQADRVRVAAGQTLAALERRREIVLSLFQELQPVFVKASEDFASSFDRVSVRDLLWREANAAWTAVERRLLEDDLQEAYVALYGYHPALRDLVRASIREMRTRESRAVDEFVVQLQDAMLRFETDRNTYQTAHLGNVLRAVAAHYRQCIATAEEQSVAPLEEFLTALVLAPDEEILRGKDLDSSIHRQLVAARKSADENAPGEQPVCSDARQQ